MNFSNILIDYGLLEIINKLHHTKFETVSRFVDGKPRYRTDDELISHFLNGGGLGCGEKSRVFQRILTDKKIEAKVVTAACEWIIDGRNQLAHKGAGSKPINEAFYKPFFAKDRETSPYEIPAHLGHWANSFWLDNKLFLVDLTGGPVPLRVFAGEEAEAILNNEPKPYFLYLPQQLRQYYHTISDEFLELVRYKEANDRLYYIGRFVSGPIMTTEHSIIQARWWWREERYEAEKEASQNEPTMQVYKNITFLKSPESIRNYVPELNIEDAKMIVNAWPTIVETIKELFDSPSIIELTIVEAPRPLKSYSTSHFFKV